MIEEFVPLVEVRTEEGCGVVRTLDEVEGTLHQRQPLRPVDVDLIEDDGVLVHLGVIVLGFPVFVDRPRGEVIEFTFEVEGWHDDPSLPSGFIGDAELKVPRILLGETATKEIAPHRLHVGIVLTGKWEETE